MHYPQLVIAALAVTVSTTVATASHKRLHSHLEEKRQDNLLWGDLQGCYSSLGTGFNDLGSYAYQTTKYCNQQCIAGGNVYALSGSDCSCGTEIPPTSAKVDSSLCSFPCTVWQADNCGSSDGSYFAIYAIPGSTPTVQQGTIESSSVTSVISSTTVQTSTKAVSLTTTSTSSTTPIPPSTSAAASTHTTDSVADTTTIKAVPTTVIIGASTIVKTVAASTSKQASATPTADPATSDNAEARSKKTIGVVVGIVAGIVAIIALIVGGLFYARRRRRAINAKNSHQRADSLNAFVASGASLPGVSFNGMTEGTLPALARDPIISNDSRLDPRIMVEQKRQSAGSVFADNQDYSRRILKVANPDGH